MLKWKTSEPLTPEEYKRKAMRIWLGQGGVVAK
jgi:hypothetical protein